MLQAQPQPKDHHISSHTATLPAPAPAPSRPSFQYLFYFILFYFSLSLYRKLIWPFINVVPTILYYYIWILKYWGAVGGTVKIGGGAHSLRGEKRGVFLAKWEAPSHQRICRHLTRHAPLSQHSPHATQHNNIEKFFFFFL